MKTYPIDNEYQWEKPYKLERIEYHISKQHRTITPNHLKIDLNFR